ncbi:MAG TPA: hypothetical protein VGS06_24205 [Streptosporangiaceae bacterium]|nr:hypothetical protein [Streptosporangiaceae bacterium]
MSDDSRAAGAAAVTVVLWASAFVAIRSAGGHFAPGALALGRLLGPGRLMGACNAGVADGADRLTGLGVRRASRFGLPPGIGDIPARPARG